MTTLMVKNHWIPTSNNWGKNFLQAINELIERYVQSSQQRRALLEMDTHQLNDIGISRFEAIQMARSSWSSKNPDHR